MDLNCPMPAVCVLKNTIFPRKNSPRLAQLAPPFVTDAARGVLRVAPSALLAHNGEVARRRGASRRVHLSRGPWKARLSTYTSPPSPPPREPPPPLGRRGGGAGVSTKPEWEGAHLNKETTQAIWNVARSIRKVLGISGSIFSRELSLCHAPPASLVQTFALLLEGALELARCFAQPAGGGRG